MNMQAFEQQLGRVVGQNSWNRAVLCALLTKLYLYSLTKTRQAKGLPAGTREWTAKVYVVSLVLRHTPLGLLPFLAEDPDLRIDVPDELVKNGKLCTLSGKAMAQALMELEIDGILYWAVAAWQTSL